MEEEEVFEVGGQTMSEVLVGDDQAIGGAWGRRGSGGRGG